MQNYLLIVAGGTGTRMGSEIPKQFLEISGLPLIVHTINKFISADAQIKIIVAVHPNWKHEMTDIQKKYFPTYRMELTEGGGN